MQKLTRGRKTAQDVLAELEHSFNELPLVPRDCVRSLNILLYSLQHTAFDAPSYKRIIYLVLRGFTSSDNYLKNYLHTVLIELSRHTSDGILAINCIIKDIDNRKTPSHMKNNALRALFSCLPTSMYYDFEKYISSSVLDNNGAGVVLASIYFNNKSIPVKINGDIRDYHQAFFNRLPINRYSSMVELKRLARMSPEELATFFFMSTDPVVFFEAVKQLRKLRPEVAAPFIEKAVHVLKAYARIPGVESFITMKVLCDLSANFPTKVARANQEIEDLVRCPHKCISMLAVITLLRTGTDETMDALTSKLEPYLQSMSNSYKRMAIDTMEKLFLKSKRSSSRSYAEFLRKALSEKSSCSFKSFLMHKFDQLLRNTEDKEGVLNFLCGYLEDPVYSRTSVDILGILGEHLDDPRALVHVFNRLILDDSHVRRAAIQTLFDLQSKALSDNELSLDSFRDGETEKLCDLLSASGNLKRGVFTLDELGAIKESVEKYITVEDAATATADRGIQHEDDGNFIKDCRRIFLTKPSDDISISVVKKIHAEEAILELSFENKMDKVEITTALLTLEADEETYTVELSQDQFVDGSAAVELQIPVSKDIVVNGVFEYQIKLDEDLDTDSISLEPFTFTLFDFVRPLPVEAIPHLNKEIEFVLDCKASEAASRIIDITNMHLIADRDKLTMSGLYKGSPIIMEADLRFSRVTTVSMVIWCDRQDIIDEICPVFE